MKKIIVGILFVGLMAACSREAAVTMEPGAKHFAQPTTLETFAEDVLKSDQPVVVDFFATWCGPCRQVAPTLEALAKEYDGKVKVVKVDIDKNEELAQQYQIRSIPTFFAFKDGKLVEGKTGAMSKKAFKSWFDSLAATTPEASEVL